MSNQVPLLPKISALLFVLIGGYSSGISAHEGHDATEGAAIASELSEESAVNIDSEATPFDAEDSSAPIIVRPENLRQLEKSGLLLTAIFYGKDSDISLAVIEDQSRTWGIYKAGDEINDQTVLVDILDDRVIIEKKAEGQVELGFSYELTGVNIQKL